MAYVYAISTNPVNICPKLNTLVDAEILPERTKISDELVHKADLCVFFASDNLRGRTVSKQLSTTMT